MGAAAAAGTRASMRRIRDDDLEGIRDWYSEAAGAAYEERSLEGIAANGNVFVIMQVGGEEVIGLVEYEAEGDWLAVSFIALAKAYRGWGYGSEAVRLLEEWAVREGVAERFRTEVDARNGLGLYFWLRLGYQPAGWQAEGGRDSMAMVRDAAGLNARGR